jgi:hypothetical protein
VAIVSLTKATSGELDPSVEEKRRPCAAECNASRMPRRDRQVVGEPGVAGPRHPAFNRDGAIGIEATTGRRHARCGARLDDGGQRAETIEDGGIERRGGCCGVASRRNRDPHGQHVVGLESRRDLLQGDQASSEQHRQKHQQHGERDLAANEHAPQSL